MSVNVKKCIKTGQIFSATDDLSINLVITYELKTINVHKK